MPKFPNPRAIAPMLSVGGLSHSQDWRTHMDPSLTVQMPKQEWVARPVSAGVEEMLRGCYGLHPEQIRMRELSNPNGIGNPIPKRSLRPPQPVFFEPDMERVQLRSAKSEPILEAPARTPPHHKAEPPLANPIVIREWPHLGEAQAEYERPWRKNYEQVAAAATFDREAASRSRPATAAAAAPYFRDASRPAFTPSRSASAAHLSGTPSTSWKRASFLNGYSED